MEKSLAFTMEFCLTLREFLIIMSTLKEILERIKLAAILYHVDMISGYSEHDLIAYLQKCGF